MYKLEIYDDTTLEGLLESFKNLKDAGIMMIEIKADEVAIKLGLAEPLKSVLQKLKLSKFYSCEQCQLIDFRMSVLN